MIVDRKASGRNQLSTSASWLGHEFLPDVKLRICRKESFRGKNSSRSQVARRDRFLVFNMLSRINQDTAGCFLDRMVLGPLCQHGAAGVEQLHLDALVRGKFEID